MRRRLIAMLVLLAAMLSLLGCAGADEAGSEVPESASLAPADALVYATLTTDETSGQWEQAERLLDRLPGARDGLTGRLDVELGKSGLSWQEIAAAVGPEVVIVGLADAKAVVLTQPDDEDELAALLQKADEPLARGSVNGWVAIAEQQSELDAYTASLARGTLAGDDAFAAGFAALPAEAIARAWIDVAGLTPQLGQELGQAAQDLDIGLDWVSMAVAAEEDGIRLAVGTRTPGGNGTEYEPELASRVPDDAIAALSFGGTQQLVDRIRRGIPLDEVADQVESVTGVSVDGILDAFSGEGMLYVRQGDSVPELTLVLAPPDADGVWDTVDRLARTLARESGTTVRTVTEGGTDVSVVDAQGVTVRYARLDGDTVIVTTGAQGIADYTSDGAKLPSSDAFRRAADEVGLDERTAGFLYVDIDGLVPLIEGVSGQDLPADDRSALEQLDAFILQSSGGGDTNSLSGFLRLSD